MTTDIEALIAEARSHPTIAGKATVGLIDRLADALESVAAERDAAIKEMHARELHHFEEEQKSAALHAIIEEALSVPGGMHVMNRTWRECAEEMRRILFRGTAEKGADDDH